MITRISENASRVAFSVFCFGFIILVRSSWSLVFVLKRFSVLFLVHH